MNIKKLRINYKNLSLKERLILLDSAELRDDESEIQAIVSASPKETWTMCDFVESKNKLQTFRFIRLIQRLKHLSECLLWLYLSERKTEEISGSFFDSACMEAYFYCVHKQVDEAIFKEIGLDNTAWKERENESFNLDFEKKLAEEYLISIAFSEAEAEAEEFLQNTARKKDFQNPTLNFTFEKELEGFREVLKDSGLI
jgi:hypothetical protein